MMTGVYEGCGLSLMEWIMEISERSGFGGRTGCYKSSSFFSNSLARPLSVLILDSLSKIELPAWDTLEDCWAD